MTRGEQTATLEQELNDDYVFIRTSGLSDGVYLLRLGDKNVSKYHKVLIKNRL
ncbi:MAG: T9SS type A sorting domain-containing protein [Psychroserpens sp.]|uniref:T9SS type A sorting domain-containing protein n=1 Tax=Psychroserpens sp. TaxID=2020870 RepID=UPI003C7F8300